MPVIVRRTPGELLTGLGPVLQVLLARVATLAQAQGCVLWLVGGVVRDLLLGLPVERDVDLAVEGDAVALAELLGVQLGGRVIAVHAPFGTATVEINPNSDTNAAAPGLPIFLDLASTRTESYPHPAALPLVQRADITHDLIRRDFSVNAIALELHAVADQLQPARLLDPFAGERDLEAGLLRVLHDASFDDDPTRILRGLRLAARLDLQSEPHTAARCAAALASGRLEATSPDRVRSELCLALSEPRPDAVLHLADSWGLTPHIFPALGWSPLLAERCHRLAQSDGQIVACTQAALPDLYLGLLTYDLTTAERNALIARYHLPGTAVRLLHDVAALRSLLPKLTPGLANSALDQLLRPFNKTALAVVHYAESSPTSDSIAHYLMNLYDLMPQLDGYDLQRLGVPPGPALGRLLRELRTARLDGLLATREEEEAWVLAKHPVSGTGA